MRRLVTVAIPIDEPQIERMRARSDEMRQFLECRVDLRAAIGRHDHERDVMRGRDTCDSRKRVVSSHRCSYRRTLTTTYGVSLSRSGYIRPRPFVPITSTKYMRSHCGSMKELGICAWYVPALPAIAVIGVVW